MDFTEYRQRGKEMVDYIADYLENIRDRRVFPDVKPGYMKNLLPDSAPIEGEQWDAIFGDVERVIMPGITHWQSPHMHAYFPALNSFPSLLGDMLADAINCLGFTWASSPACTELEIIVMNWLGKMINLPDDFLHLSSTSRGGGVVQTTASEATLVCLLAGRTRAIQRFHEKRPGYQDAEINARLVAYCSDQAHSSVEKAALIGLVRMRYIEADENLSMRGQLLRDAIQDDIRQGLVPFWVCATLGTTGSCSFDNLEEVGIVCREFNLWLHVDAAYAGSAFICPEFRTWLKGIKHADSIAFNPSKWLMIHFDATALWVKDSTAVHRTFNVEPLYLQHENSGVAVDFMHWQIPLSRRFRALKIWFVLRSFGIKGLQRHIREGVRLAQKFEALVLADHRFEIPAKRHLGLVVFRIKGDNEITERLLKRLNHRGNLHCIPSSLKGKYVIRFTVTSTRTTVDDILSDWMEIKSSATAILDEMNITISSRVYLKDTKEKCEGFGSSLLLSNSPLSPKIVNGSFAALFDADEFLAKTYAGIRIAHQESPSMRRRVRGILMSGKQFSLDSHMDVVVQTSMNSRTTNSKVVDCYGKTAANIKTDEHDAICEDEESLEDCEINWILNTLQLSPKNYLAILNNTKLSPIDTIQHRNNLSILKKYSTNYEVKNFTKSVNSVRTPLTQCKLYKCHRQPSYRKQNIIGNSTEKHADLSDLYPGKRYLNLDLNLYHDSIFTDTIFNLPTPTEDIIPIIITADTPTTSINASVQVFEDFHKLRPPSTNISTANETQNLAEMLLPNAIINSIVMNGKDSPKPSPPDISSIPKPKTINDYQNETEVIAITCCSDVLNETTSNPNSLIKVYSSTTVTDFWESNKESILKSSAKVDDNSVSVELKSSIEFNPRLFQYSLKEVNNESNKQLETLTPKPSTLEDGFSVSQVTNNENNIQTAKYSVSSNSNDIQKPQSSNINVNAAVLKELNTKSTILSETSAIKSMTDVSVFEESNISFLVDDFSVSKNLETSINNPKSSNVVEDASVTEETNNKPKIFNSKSKDDSSSSDEFLESVRQPSSNSEGSSTASSSLELM